jgi:hypothetical protein
MSDNRDEKLESLLRSRRLEPASPDLAQRIISTARQLPQNRTMPVWQWICELFSELHLPKPAYVLASALILGMLIGFNAPGDNDDVDDGGFNIQTFLSGDEALL